MPNSLHLRRASYSNSNATSRWSSIGTSASRMARASSLETSSCSAYSDRLTSGMLTNWMVMSFIALLPLVFILC